MRLLMLVLLLPLAPLSGCLDTVPPAASGGYREELVYEGEWTFTGDSETLQMEMPAGTYAVRTELSLDGGILRDAWFALPGCRAALAGADGVPVLTPGLDGAASCPASAGPVELVWGAEGVAIGRLTVIAERWYA